MMHCIKKVLKNFIRKKTHWIVIKFIDTFAQLSHSCSIIPQQSPWALLYIILQTRAQRDLKKGEES